MGSLHRTFAVVYAAILIFALPLVGLADPSTPMSELDIRTMFDGSQAVLVGTVTGARLLGESDPAILQSETTRIQRWEATIRVLQAYKGNVGSTIRVAFTVQVPASSSRYGPSLDRGETALLFLVDSSDGRYAFANPEWGKFRLSSFVRSNKAGSGPELLESDLDRTLADNTSGTKNVLDVLLTFRKISAMTESQAAALSGSQNVGVAAEAFAVLLNTRKNQYYAKLAQFLSQKGSAVRGDDLVAIFSRVQDPGSNADPKIFDELSTLPLPPIELAAMYALRKIRSPESVSTLIGHLDDPDNNIRYLAVIALNEILQNGDDFGPSNSDFDRNPQAYIDRWKHWWDREGKVKYSP